MTELTSRTKFRTREAEKNIFEYIEILQPEKIALYYWISFTEGF